MQVILFHDEQSEEHDTVTWYYSPHKFLLDEEHIVAWLRSVGITRGGRDTTERYFGFGGGLSLLTNTPTLSWDQHPATLFGRPTYIASWFPIDRRGPMCRHAHWLGYVDHNDVTDDE